MSPRGERGARTSPPNTNDPGMTAGDGKNGRAPTEALLENRVPDAETIASAKVEIRAEIRPIDDFRSTAAYRRQVAGNLLEEFLRGLSQDSRRD